MTFVELALSVQIVCTGTGAAAGREFVFDRPAEDRPWRVAYRDREHPQWIRLALPGASPEVTADTARMTYRNANGGRQVQLDVSPARSRLDLYVDYGLDVNIEPDLDPEIDRMNTEGPLIAVTCRIQNREPVNP
jgi:hypothetical protein